jgi:hypothetical protein
VTGVAGGLLLAIALVRRTDLLGRPRLGPTGVPYNAAMRSQAAREVSRSRARRLAALSPAERIALARRLGEEGIAVYMVTHGVDRRTAIARIKATHRLGRRHSPSAVADEH